MTQLLTYSFFQYALIAVCLIAAAAAIIGTYIITRRMVALAGGITHACFGGLGLGYFLGISPTVMAAVFAVGSSLGVEWMSRYLRIREDSATAVIWSVGMAVGVLFVFLTPGYVPELNSFLFGNILTVTPADIAVFAGFTALLIVFVAIYYHQIVACAFDSDFAAVCGLPVRFITIVMNVMTAVCIVLTIRLVGIMLLMSMFSLPIMIAESRAHTYGRIMLLSALTAIVASVLGLFVSAFVDIPCSALIVLILAAVYIPARIIK